MEADCSKTTLAMMAVYWILGIGLLIAAVHLIINYMDFSDPLAFFALDSWVMWVTIVLVVLTPIAIYLITKKQKAWDATCCAEETCTITQ